VAFYRLVHQIDSQAFRPSKKSVNLHQPTATLVEKFDLEQLGSSGVSHFMLFTASGSFTAASRDIFHKPELIFSTRGVGQNGLGTRRLIR